MESSFNTCSSCEEQLNSIIKDNQVPRFQYMLLLRGATDCFALLPDEWTVSIHAPLARSNKFLFRRQLMESSFNTCSSCEEQPLGSEEVTTTGEFQYMLLLRGATRRTGQKIPSGVMFQYMLLLRGATRRDFCNVIHDLFQYMLLLRGATRCTTRAGRRIRFQYMLLLRGATQSLRHAAAYRFCFNTCSSCEEQLGSIARGAHGFRFITCSSCEEQQRFRHCPSLGICFNTCSSCEEQLSGNVRLL